jgi:hypothetical protein
LLLPFLEALDEDAKAAVSTTAHYGKRKKNLVDNNSVFNVV